MNRREWIAGLVGAAAASGVAMTADVVEASKTGARPALILLEMPHSLSRESLERLKAGVSEALKATPFEGVKVFVLADGAKLTVLGDDGRVLNRRAPALSQAKPRCMGSLQTVSDGSQDRGAPFRCPVCERLICVSDRGRLLPHAAMYPEMVKAAAR